MVVKDTHIKCCILPRRISKSRIPNHITVIDDILHSFSIQIYIRCIPSLILKYSSSFVNLGNDE